MAKRIDPYSPGLWNPKVDVIVRPPKPVPNNFYWLGRPADPNTYSTVPPSSETYLVRKNLNNFKTQAKADKWARENHEVVEILHTARTFCWRVKK